MSDEHPESAPPQWCFVCGTVAAHERNGEECRRINRRLSTGKDEPESEE